MIGWHCEGLGLFWSWKIRAASAATGGTERVRQLILLPSRENPQWGAPHIHGELLKLGIDIDETSISKYMVRRPQAALADLENIPG